MDNSVAILNSINATLNAIAKQVAPQNSPNTPEGVASLNRSGVSAPTSSVLNGAGAASLAIVISSLKGLPEEVKAIAKLKDRTVDGFSSVLRKIVESINDIKIDPASSKGIANLLDGVSKLGTIPKDLAASFKYMPFAYLAAMMMTPLLSRLMLSITMVAGFSMTQPAALAFSAVVGTLMLIPMGMAKSLKYMPAALLATKMLPAVVLGIQKAFMLFKSINDTTVLAIKEKVDNMMSALFSIQKFCLMCALMIVICVGVGLILSNPKTWLLMGIGFIGLTLVMGLIMGTMFLMSKVSSFIKAELPKTRGLFEFYILAALVVVLSLAVGYLIRKNFLGILFGFVSLTAVVIAMAGVIALISNISGVVKEQAKGILILAGVYLLAAGIIFVSKWVGDYVSKPGIWKPILLGFAAVTTVVLAIAGISFLVSKIARYARGAVKDMLILKGIMVGAFGLILFANFVVGKIAGNEGKIAVLMLATAGFITALAGVVALIGSVPKTVLLLGIATIALVEVLMAGMMGVILIGIRVIERLNEVKQAVGGNVEGLKQFVKDIGSIFKELTFKTFNPHITIIEMGILAAKYGAFALFTAAMCSGISSISKMSAMVTNDGKIRPIKGKNPETGEYIFGDDGIDVPAMAGSICGAIHSFVDGLNFGFNEVKQMLAAAAITSILGMIANPINSFVTMLTGFVGGTDAGGRATLAPVIMGQDGNPIIGKPVDIAATATSIVAAINSFVTEITRPEHAERWKNQMTRENRKGVKRVGAMFDDIVDPISSFISMLTTIQGNADGTTLTKITYDSEGNPKPGATIVIADVCASIVGAIDTFVTGLFGSEKIGEWKNASRNAEIFTNILSPVTNFKQGLMTFVNEPIDNNALETALLPFKTFRDVLTPYIDGTIDASKVSRNIRGIQRIMTNGMIRMSVMSTRAVSRFGGAVKDTRNSLKDFDDVLSDTFGRRTRAVKKLSDDMDEILTKFKDSEEAIKQFNTAVEKVNTYKSASSRSFGFRGGSEGVSGQSENKGNPLVVEFSEQSAEIIRNAIMTAISQMSFTMEVGKGVSTGTQNEIAMGVYEAMNNAVIKSVSAG